MRLPIVKRRTTLYCDTETTGLYPFNGDLPYAVGNLWGDIQNDPEIKYYEWKVDPYTRGVYPPKGDLTELQDLLDSFDSVTYHNSPFDLQQKAQFGLRRPKRVEDTLFAARICNTLEEKYGLKPLAYKYFDYPVEDIDFLKAAVRRMRLKARKLGWCLGESMESDYWLCQYVDELLPDITEEEKEQIKAAVGVYCIGDVLRTGLLWELKYRDEITQDPHYRKTYEDELALLPVCMAMEERGMGIYKSRCEEQLKYCENKSKKHLEILRKMVKEVEVSPVTVVTDKLKGKSREKVEFNPNSPKQISQILYNSLANGGFGLRPIKKSKAGQNSTDWKALRPYQEHPFVREYLLYKSADKAINTFFQKFLDVMQPDPLVEDADFFAIHSVFNQMGTLTGRFSCVAKGSLVLVGEVLGDMPLEIPIERVRTGDIVVTYDENLSLTTSQVLNTWKTGFREVVELVVMDNKEGEQVLKLTPEHPVRLDSGDYRTAESLLPGDFLLCVPIGGRGFRRKVVEVRRTGEKCWVYDLEIEGTSNFIANEICVHNSSGVINAQQIANPESSPRGTDIAARYPFGPRPGYVWYAADYAQMELRVFADIANVPGMLKTIYAGEDLNNYNTNLAWGGKGNPAALEAAAHALELGHDEPTREEIQEVWDKYGWNAQQARHGMRSSGALQMADQWLGTFEYNIVAAEKSIEKSQSRQRGKTVMFVKMYGGGASAVTDLLFCSEEEAEKFMRQFDRAFPEINKFIQSISKQAEQDGCIINRYGRKLRVDSDTSYRSCNYSVQGSCADLMKRAMYRSYHYLKDNGIDGHLLATIHDEIIFEIKKGEDTLPVLRTLKGFMEDTEGRIKVPMLIEMKKIDSRWDRKVPVVL